MIFFITLHAEGVESDNKPFSFRLGYGVADANNLGDILIGDWNRYDKETTVINMEGGWRFVENAFDYPFDFYLKGGVSYFDENGYAEDFLEATLYIKVYGKVDFWDNRLRIGFGEGFSYAQHVPIAEVDDAANNDGTSDPTTKFLNYLDISFDIDLGRLVRIESIKDTYLGYTLKHRSGVFGLYGRVHGGSNYNMVTLEKNF